MKPGGPASDGRPNGVAAGASIAQQVIWNEEYVRASCPARVGVFGEGLLGPTLIAYGTEEQKRRFLEPIRLGRELWCQGYSEPDAGSDLANVRTSAVLDGDEWVVTGQKVWTSLAQWADWCFVLARTDRDEKRHKGLSYLLVPMRQPGVQLRPITQLTGTSEFNEVFFDEARTPSGHGRGRCRETGGGSRSRPSPSSEGVALLGHQVRFSQGARHGDRSRAISRVERRSGHAPTHRGSLDHTVHPPHEHVAIASGPRRSAVAPPRPRFPSCSGAHGIVTSVSWQWTWRGSVRRLRQLFRMNLSELQRLFLFSRADTIYGGSNEIQRNIVAERVLGLPPEPKGTL